MTKIIRGKQAEEFLKSILDNDEPKIFLTRVFDEQLVNPTVDKTATVEITREQFDDANDNGCGSVLARITIRAYADQQDATIDRMAQRIIDIDADENISVDDWCEHIATAGKTPCPSHADCKICVKRHFAEDKHDHI